MINSLVDLLNMSCSCTTGVTWRHGPSITFVLLRTGRSSSATSSVQSCRSGWLCLPSLRWTAVCATLYSSPVCSRCWCLCTWMLAALPPTLFPSLLESSSFSSHGWVSDYTLSDDIFTASMSLLLIGLNPCFAHLSVCWLACITASCKQPLLSVCGCVHLFVPYVCLSKLVYICQPLIVHMDGNWESQGFHTSWKDLDFLLENSSTWKVLEKYYWKSFIFYRLKQKSFFFCSLCLQIISSPLLLNLWCQYVIFKHSWASKRSWKIFHGVLESHGFFVSKRVGTLEFGGMENNGVVSK